jgi:hypothetical protein
MNPSLIQLSEFVPNNDAEMAIYNIDAEKYIIQKYIDDSKSSWAKGKYYLGGQIRVEPSEPITPELFKQAWKPFCDGSCNDYSNSYEAASIISAKRGLSSIDKIVRKYIEVQKLRILKELEKTKLVTDINKTIVGYI